MVEDLSHWCDISQRLDQLSWCQLVQTWRSTTQGDLDLIQDAAQAAPHQCQTVMEALSQVDRSQQQLIDLVDILRDTIASLRDQAVPHYERVSEELWRHEMANDTPEDVLGSPVLVDQDLRSRILGRVNPHARWQAPGAILRPGNLFGLNAMVAMDPLYLVDTDPGLLEPARKFFNDDYQRRLRLITVPRLETPPNLEALPPAQLGVVLAWDFFNRLPQSQVNVWLSQLWTRMAPGGRVMMTINDCERAGAIRLVERRFRCWNTATATRDAAMNLGFLIEHEEAIDSSRTWFELARPGCRISMRGGQSLGRIRYLARNIDKPTENDYNDTKHDKILQQARELGIDTNQPLKQLRRSIKERKNK